MAYWIQDIDNDLINLDQVNQIFIKAPSKKTCIFSVICRIGHPTEDLLIQEFDSYDLAREFMNSLVGRKTP